MGNYFMLWVTIQSTWFYCLLCSILATVSTCSCSHISFTYPCHFGCFYFLSTFLLSGTTTCSKPFFVPVLKSAIPPRSPGSFYQRMVLQAKIWTLTILTDTGVIFASDPLNRQLINCIYIYIYICVCVCVCVYVYMYICVCV